MTNDLLGLYEKFLPKFVKQYIRLHPRIQEALEAYVREVKEGAFPGPEHGFPMDTQDLKSLLGPPDKSKK